MATTGHNTVASGANSTLEGTRTWSNTGNITANDNTYATVSILSNETSNILRGYNVNMSAIPDGAQIDGIQVIIRRLETTASGATDNTVRLMDGTSFRGNDLSPGTTIPTSELAITVGGSSQLWGTTWNTSIIKASTFGVGYGATWLSNKSTVVSVDDMTISVWYTTAPADPTSLTIDSSTANTVDLSWTDNASDESGYSIERQVDGGGYSVLDNTLAANTTSYQDTTVVAGSTYDYRVQALGTGPDSDYSNVVSVSITATSGSPIFFE